MPSNGNEGATVGADVLSGDAGIADAAAIRSQLGRVLASPHFCQSKRCQMLLQHVVDAYLDGSLERVKERCIGFEVFHRDADYDTSRDSIVRTTAAEVRKRLAQYYLEPEHEREIRIVVPHGSYSPEFRTPAAIPLADPASAPTPTPLLVTPAPRPRRLSWWIAAAVVVVVAGAAVALYLRLRPNQLV